MIRTCVIGVGFMGNLHCKAYSSASGADFVGVYDVDQKKAQETAQKYNVRDFTDLGDLLLEADAASIAVPTTLHHEYALKCIEKKIDVLIEKPLAHDLESGRDIVEKCAANKVMAAVGHIERFNPAVVKLLEMVKGKEIISIGASRVAPPVQRANDVSVVFDLMIHDLDIVMEIAGHAYSSVVSKGKKQGSEVLNDVETTIEFSGGAKGSVCASKIAAEKRRIIKVTCKDAVFEADLIEKIIEEEDVRTRTRTRSRCEGEEPIKAEINDFLLSIDTGSAPMVSAQDSMRSLELAWEIEKNCVLS